MGPVALGKGEAGLAVSRGVDVEALVRQASLEQRHELRVVVDQEDTRRFVFTPRNAEISAPPIADLNLARYQGQVIRPSTDR
jgi:hypothetical protein